MDDRLYKQQMDRMRAIEHSEGDWWEDAKGVAGALVVLIAFPLLALAAFASVIAAVLGLLH